MDAHDFDNGILYHGDCLTGLTERANNSVTLGFTSPPYFNAVNYEAHTETMNADSDNDDDDDNWEREDMSYESYKQFLIERFEEVFHVTKPGGHTVVNISPIHWNGERIPIPFHFVGWMQAIGWTFCEDIVWEKPVAKDRRSGVLLQYPYPGYYYPSVVTEYILVFQKDAASDRKNNIYWDRSDDEKQRNELDLDEYQGEQSKNVWTIRQVAPDENEHPAPFPTELADRIIKFYSYKDDTVMDIFTGSAQTLLAAQDRGRDFLGYETQAEYVDYAVERLSDNA